MSHPLWSRLRDRFRRPAPTNQPTVHAAPVPRHVDPDGDTVWQIALPVRPDGHRAVLASRNGGGLYRGHRVGYNASPGPQVRPAFDRRVAL